MQHRSRQRIGSGSAWAEAVRRVRGRQPDLASRRPAGGDSRGGRRVPGPLRDAGESRDAESAPSTSPRAGYPLKFAFGGAAKGPNPYVNIINRLQVVQFEDFDGVLRTLAYEPTVPEGPAEAPLLRAADRAPGRVPLLQGPGERSGTSPTRRSATVGLRPEDVDFVSFDHLHVQDLRFVLGTTEPIEGEAAAAAAAVPEREADRAAQGVGHVRVAAPDAVGLVRRGRDQGPDHRQRRPRRRRRRARQGRARWSGPRATRTATTRSASTPPTGSGSLRRTASPPTPGTRTSRGSRAFARPPSSSAAR